MTLAIIKALADLAEFIYEQVKAGSREDLTPAVSAEIARLKSTAILLYSIDQAEWKEVGGRK